MRMVFNLNFADKLLEKIKEKNSSCIIGLDPIIDLFPQSITKNFNIDYSQDNENAIYETIIRFNYKIIDAVYDIIPAVKPQLAFYEVFGYKGIKAFEATCEYAKRKGLLVILDGKRNDIGSTAEAYSKAYLNSDNKLGSDIDSITVNGYLGSDGINPFIKDCTQYGKGIFVLVKTSNNSSKEIQDLKVGERKIYEIMAQYVNEWGNCCIGMSGYSSIGAVVGATFPDELYHLRQLMPKAIFLVPGYGTQGGTATTVRNAFNSDGYGAVISASRSVLYAYKAEKWIQKFREDEFDLAARAETEDMRLKINNVR
jgi:orotidine 5''-phosphate decarboxylase, subfamily 2